MVRYCSPTAQKRDLHNYGRLSSCEPGTFWRSRGHFYSKCFSNWTTRCWKKSFDTVRPSYTTFLSHVSFKLTEPLYTAIDFQPFNSTCYVSLGGWIGDKKIKLNRLLPMQHKKPSVFLLVYYLSRTWTYCQPVYDPLLWFRIGEDSSFHPCVNRFQHPIRAVSVNQSPSKTYSESVK